MSPLNAAGNDSVPLCIDLDGTLINTDMLWESLVRLLRHRPFYLLLVPWWWLRGRAFLKQQLARRTTMDAARLPYHKPFLEFLRAEHRSGRRLLLVTASDRRLAEPVAAHVGLFAEVLASDGNTNLRGRNKAARLVESFGERGFDYAGNSSVDLPVWARARQAIVVNGSGSLVRRARARTTVGRVFPAERPRWRALVRTLRPGQWRKNLLVFLPLVLARQVMQRTQLGEALLAFAALCACAAGGYVLNDLLDLDADRRDPAKQSRPLATGTLPLSLGLVGVPVLLAGGIALGALRSWPVAGLLAGYVALGTIYSWRLKPVAFLDVLCLAGRDTLRLCVGCAALGRTCSSWLVVFSLFFFLSLALVKRFAALSAVALEDQPPGHERGPAVRPARRLVRLGMASGCLAVLVLALYAHSQQGVLPHREPILLLICPLLLGWLSRVWWVAQRGQMHDDPLVFALQDRTSFGFAALTVLALWLASHSWS